MSTKLTRISVQSLSPKWQQAISSMRQLGLPARYCNRFAAHCDEKKIPFEEVTDLDLSEFIDGRVRAGEINERSALTIRLEIVADLRRLKERDPSAPATRIATETTYAYRKRQYDQLTPTLKANFEDVKAKAWSARDEQTQDAQVNKLLRVIELLESSGTAIANLMQLTEAATLDRLEKLKFGVRDEGVSEARKGFLSLAKDIAFALSGRDSKLMGELVEYTKAWESPSRGFPRAKLEAILKLDTAAQSALLKLAKETLALSGASPWVGWIDGQYALAISLAWITCQKVGHIHRAEFVVPYAKDCPDIELARIVLRGREVPMPASFIGPIARFRKRNAHNWLSGINAIFVASDGTQKASCTVSLGTTRLARQVNIATSLEIIAGASVLAMLRAKTHPDEVQKHLGIVQKENFWARYWQLIELSGHKEFVDLVTKWKGGKS